MELVSSYKICTMCKRELPVVLFGENKKNECGLLARCKECTSVVNRIYRESDRVKEMRRIRDRTDLYKEKHRLYHRTDKSKATQKRKWQSAECRAKKAIYEKTDRCKELRRVRYQMSKSLPKTNLNYFMSRGIYRALKEGKCGRKWEELVGYSADELKSHIEKQFSDGMTWDNYGKWHIDHIIPRALFSFSNSSDVEFRKCWELSNLQPLWGEENMHKHTKIIKPFQPSLDLYLRKLENKGHTLNQKEVTWQSKSPTINSL